MTNSAQEEETMHPREKFDQELKQLKQDILSLGEMVDRAIEQSIVALKERDLDLARQIIANDKAINARRYAIEKKCYTLIATQQPAAGDLRTIITAIHLATELERIADHAAGIAQITVRMGGEPPLKPLIDIPRMAERDRAMLRQALNAYLAHDASLAQDIGSLDDEIDQLYDQILRELLTFMIEDPRTVTRATYLLWVSHNLERIGDRVTNIGERVIFMVTGELKEYDM